MVDQVTAYQPRSYEDLKLRSLILANGIAKFAERLPPLTEYGVCAMPAVKWVFIPRCDAADAVDCYVRVRELLDEILPDLAASMMAEDWGTAVWVWEHCRPNIKWLNERLLQMYLVARACDCYLEGWTFEDEAAWEFGLGKLIDETGFNQFYLRPGQTS